MNTGWTITCLLLALPAWGRAQRSAQGPTRSEAETLVQRLDAAFNRRDLEGLLAQFRPNHHSLYERLARRTGNLLERGGEMERKTTILEYQRRGPYGIALLEMVTKSLNHKDLSLTEHCFLVLVNEPEPKGLFVFEVDKGLRRAISEGSFRCPACNYVLAAAPQDWLAVPARQDLSGCMESVSFVSLAHDLIFEVSVHVSRSSLCATKVLESYLKLIGSRCKQQSLDPAGIQKWIPPAYEGPGKQVPQGLDGARCRLETKAGSSALTHVAVFGPIRYLLVLEGPSKVVQAQQAQIQALLRGFRLLKPEMSPKAVQALAVRMHTGDGSFDHTTYTSKKYNLRLRGPQGWQSDIWPAGHLFLLSFACPSGKGRLTVRAYGPPGGSTAWTRRRADLLLARIRAHKGPDLVDNGSWHEAEKGLSGAFQWRQLLSAPAPGPGRETSTRPQRVLQASMREDLLLLMEGKASDSERMAKIQVAMQSLGPLE